MPESLATEPGMAERPSESIASKKDMRDPPVLLLRAATGLALIGLGETEVSLPRLRNDGSGPLGAAGTHSNRPAHRTQARTAAAPSRRGGPAARALSGRSTPRPLPCVRSPDLRFPLLQPLTVSCGTFGRE